MSEKQIRVEMRKELAGGVYANSLRITHTPEEFVLDFLFAQPQRGQQGRTVASLRSRVVTSLEHMKRILRAVEENLRRYEAKYGAIEEATDLPQMIH